MNEKSKNAPKQPPLEKKPLKESTPDVGKEYKRPLRPLRQQEPKKRPQPKKKK